MTINDTKMKYISVRNKLYEITKLSFFYMTIEAVETDLIINDVPEGEVWDISEFRNYKVKLVNNGGQAKMVDFNEWIEEHKKK